MAGEQPHGRKARRRVHRVAAPRARPHCRQIGPQQLARHHVYAKRARLLRVGAAPAHNSADRAERARHDGLPQLRQQVAEAGSAQRYALRGMRVGDVRLAAGRAVLLAQVFDALAPALRGGKVAAKEKRKGKDPARDEADEHEVKDDDGAFVLNPPAHIKPGAKRQKRLPGVHEHGRK
uniref:Uncharacterized protein n=1 Tax=Diacronema lutheri TaxID=2081491 RepID=A0A7R9UJV6_DIALT